MIPSSYMSVFHLAPEIWHVTSVTIHTESDEHCFKSSGPKLGLGMNIFEQKDHSLTEWIMTMVFVEQHWLQFFFVKKCYVGYISCQTLGIKYQVLGV